MNARTLKGFSGAALLLSALSLNAAETAHAPLSLPALVEQAVSRDIWQTRSQLTEQTMQAKSAAAGFMPDPKVSMALANLPVDTFDFNQEAMTQLVLGYAQRIPRGDSLELMQQNMALQSGLQPLQRELRKAQVTLTVTNAWLNALKAQQTAAVLTKNRALLRQLEQAAVAGYATTLGQTRQLHILSADVEQARLEEKLYMLTQQQQAAEQQLHEWLRSADSLTVDSPEATFDFTEQTPVTRLFDEQFLQAGNISDQRLVERLQQHPAIALFAQQVAVTDNSYALTEQKYKPEWTFNASYGYRGEDAMGRDRADLLTLGVSMDLPLFTRGRIDHELQAVATERESIKTDRLLALRTMLSSFHQARVQWLTLEERRTHYQNVLLPKLRAQTKAAKNAYQNDDGNYSDMLKTRVATLNTQVELINIVMEQQKQMAQMNYLLAPNTFAKLQETSS